MSATREQAAELNQFIISQLEQNGFGEIADEVLLSLSQNQNYRELAQSPENVLNVFLEQTISSLRTRSNDKYARLLARFNELVDGENPVTGIEVELVEQGKDNYDLADLPSYMAMIGVLEEVQEQINKP